MMEGGEEDPFNYALLDCVLDMFPGDMEYQHILNDLDEKLKANAESIEECLSSLRLEVNAEGSSGMLQNNTDCLQWLSNCHLKPPGLPETPHCQVIQFLTTLQYFLKNNEKQEDMILQFLSDLSSQCGVSFAGSPSGVPFHCTSQASLHVVDDNSSMEVQTLWDDIRLHLRRYLVSKLQDNLDTYKTESKINVKIQYLQHLLFLYPESEVLLKYQNIQQGHVVRLLRNHSNGTIEMVLKDYQDTLSKVYSMINEDLFVLSHIVDSQLIMTFINETFFECITEEMKMFFELLCETNNQEHSLPQKQSKKKNKQRVHAFGPAAEDHPRTTSDKYLILNQLKSLSKYLKLLLWLEEKVAESASEILFISSSTEVKGSVQGVLKSDCSESKPKDTYTWDDGSLPVLMPCVLQPALKFEWRNSLKAWMDSLLQCLPAEVEDFTIQILHSSSNSSVISLVSVTESYEFYGDISEEHKPKKIAKFCFDVTEEFDTLLPLALAGKHDALKEIKTCFVDSFSKVAALILTRLEEWLMEVPSLAPLHAMIGAVATATHVLHHFKHYSDQMSKKPLFPANVQRYQEFISSLQTQITNYCINICATSLLQDAESHHWDDKKAFYEGERCSFSIQMWHYFCCGLRHDLWTVLPPVMAQKILTEVLEETLALLTFRYAQVLPNYKRASQIRIDILAIFSCVEDLLWSVCSSIQDVLQPPQHPNTIFKIHNHCNNLLTILAILTAPLKTLHEISKNIFDGLNSNPAEAAPSDHLQWLVFIKPDIFTPLVRTPSAGEMAVQGQLKMLLSQPCCNWNLLLETLLRPDCLIARTLLTSSILETSDDDTLLLEREFCKDLNVTEGILTMFSLCTLSPKSFTQLLEKYMDDENLWDFLCSQPDHDHRNSLPQVIKYLNRTLMRSVVGTVKQVTSLVLSCDPVDREGHKYIVPESLLKAVPEKWNFVPRKTKKNSSSKCITRLTAEAVSIVLSKLPSIIACLPPPIKYFYLFTERKISEQYSVLKETGILVGNLIGIICRVLEDGEAVERLTCCVLSRWSKEKLTAIGGCLEKTIGKNISEANNVAQKVLENIEKTQPKWIENQLKKAKMLSMEGDFALQEDHGRFKLTEQKINVMVLNICHKPGGSEFLRQMYHIIQLNEECLNEMISVKDPEKGSLQPGAFQMVWTSTEKELRFNPLRMFTLPNEALLAQSTSDEWCCDWSTLLPGCLDVNPVTFSALLQHRWEARDEENLTEEEKILLEDLKQITLNESPSSLNK
ncbi:uncharacterized protein KIAA0825 homolog [Spea bombifrons]|uniref:uncharacterized protein KIAA0825 homolog n=1 Tax=Spea bombifrons TaxID=233779 RepID=UPI00234A885F|nr:uncharacterized protein KIAA0825 homolog [Spea bombifrons]